MIIISKTYTEVTPESAENGEASDRGFVYQDCEYSFKELVEELRLYKYPSSSPCKGSVRDWVSSGFEIEDYAISTEREYSLHYSHLNNSRNAKYWRLALQITGLAK